MFEKAKAVLLGAVVVIAVGAALYVGGYWYANRQFSGEKQQLNAQVDAAQAQLSELSSANRLLRARFALYQAAAQLDQRNFGSANTHLHEAAGMLAGAVPGAGVAADFEALRDELAGTNIQVAEDLEAQRARVLDFGRRLDALLPANPEGAPSVASPAPAVAPPGPTTTPTPTPAVEAPAGAGSPAPQ
ncbi:MAG TPA: hypothetical protein VGA00_06305 [Acidiferrobacterales bacterium]